MSAPAIPHGDLGEHILVAVRTARKPVTFKGLAKLVKAKDEPFRAALELAVGTGQAYRWPDYRRSQYYWHVSPEQAAREAILTAASDQALAKTALSKLAAKKLPGFPVKRVETVFDFDFRETIAARCAFATGSKLLVAGATARLTLVRLAHSWKARFAPPGSIQLLFSPEIHRRVTK